MAAFREATSYFGTNSLRSACSLSATGTARSLIEAHKAGLAIEDWHLRHAGPLSVGSKKVGTVRLLPDGHFKQQYPVGSVVMSGSGEPADFAVTDRYKLWIELAGVRCFASDDPGDGDEAYFITSLTAVDPSQSPASFEQSTKRFGPQTHVESGTIFAQGFALTDSAVLVPGDGSVTIHFQLYDEESGSPEEIKQKVASATETAVRGGVAAVAAVVAGVPTAGAGAAPGAAAATAASELLGLPQLCGRKFGELIAGIFSDDLIGTLDLQIDSDFMHALIQDPNALRKTAPSIGNGVYNFPQRVEDESPEGHSWLIGGRDGQGSYRAFFKVRIEQVTPFTP
jgi:hypothetical protein